MRIARPVIVLSLLAAGPLASAGRFFAAAGLTVGL
jgi:hypothetical protein